MGILPSGQLIYDLLESSYHQHGDYYYYNDYKPDIDDGKEIINTQFSI